MTYKDHLKLLKLVRLVGLVHVTSGTSAWNWWDEWPKNMGLDYASCYSVLTETKS